MGSGFESTGEVAAVKVLAVDRDADLLDVVTYALRREGFAVAIATDAAAALERWAAERPDVVVLDLGLPRGAGSSCAGASARARACRSC